MKKYLLLMVTMLVTLFASNSFAFTPPTPEGYVMDLAGKLTVEQKAQLNAKLENINKNTKNEFAALIVPSMNGESIEDVAQDTFKAWKVGKAGLDNGVLVVIAVAERKSRIQTGKGVEGDLTDLQANDILLKRLNPHLKSGDFYGGLNETFDTISSTIESRHAAPVATPATSNSSGSGIMLFILLGLGGVGLVVYLLKRKYDAEQREYQTQVDREIQERQRVERQEFKEQEERNRLATERAAQEKQKMQAQIQKDLEKLEQKASSPVTPVVVVPVVRRSVSIAPPSVVPRPSAPQPSTKRAKPVLQTSHHKPALASIATPVVASSAALAAVELDRQSRERAEESRRRSQRESDEREARQRRDREDEDRRRRDREESDRRSSSSSSSSFDWGSSSSSGGSDSGGGFGGGDSGGGGSSSDW